MRYAQIKQGNKLHLVYEINDNLTNPICNQKHNGYRMTINIPLGKACKNCLRIVNSNSFKPNDFIKLHLS